MMKKILNFQKEKNGNISILVLVMSLAIILLITAMIGYIFHDIGFTELDKGRLRALHFAESGISYVHLKIDKYYNEDGDIDLPSGQYNENIEDNGEVQGSFLVDYVYNDDISDAPYYIVTSTGTDDKSGAKRTARVRINVILQSGLGIYDYVYAGQTATISGSFKPVDGSFYTGGDLNLTGSSAILQEYNSGPIIIKGDLKMSGDATIINPESLSVGGNVVMNGSAKIKGGQVNIAGNLTMGGGTFIDDGLVSPMIVMGDIDMKGSARIGEIGKEEELILGTGTLWSWPYIYATPDYSLEYTFIDPQYDVAALIDEYWAEVEQSALIITGDLILEGKEDGTFTPYNESSGDNRLIFTKDSDGNYILEVHGNVIINGNLQIGGKSWNPKSVNITHYKGKGIIYTTGDIKTFTKLIPFNIDDFPENALLVFVSNGNIEFDIFDYWDEPSCADSNIYVVAIAKEDIKVERGAVKGTLIAGGILDINNSFTKVCYEDGISEHLPSDLPPSGGGDIPITSGEWQEIK